MISNQRSSYYNRPHPNFDSGWHQPSPNPQWAPKPPVHEDTLNSAQLQIERKMFFLALKENPRGRLLRITEETGGRRNSIIIPASGLVEFRKLLDEMIQTSGEPSPSGNHPKSL